MKLGQEPRNLQVEEAGNIIPQQDEGSATGSRYILLALQPVWVTFQETEEWLAQRLCGTPEEAGGRKQGLRDIRNQDAVVLSEHMAFTFLATYMWPMF